MESLLKNGISIVNSEITYYTIQYIDRLLDK